MKKKIRSAFNSEEWGLVFHNDSLSYENTYLRYYVTYSCKEKILTCYNEYKYVGGSPSKSYPFYIRKDVFLNEAIEIAGYQEIRMLLGKL